MGHPLTKYENLDCRPRIAYCEALLNRPLRVATLFGLAGLASAWIFVSYARFVNRVYTAIPHGSFEAFYPANVAASQYADRQWPILCLGFPVAITAACLVAKIAGWLDHIETISLLPGLLIVYFVPVLVLFLTAVSWYALFLPALVLAAYLLKLSVKAIVDSPPPKFFRRLLDSAAVCFVFYLVISLFLDPGIHKISGWATLLIGLEVSWACLYGMALSECADFSGLFPRFHLKASGANKG
jgi:hypothetical protein